MKYLNRFIMIISQLLVQLYIVMVNNHVTTEYLNISSTLAAEVYLHGNKKCLTNVSFKYVRLLLLSSINYLLNLSTSVFLLFFQLERLNQHISQMHCFSAIHDVTPKR